MNIPTIEEIKENYKEVVSIFMNIRDIKTLMEYSTKYKVTIEVDSIPIWEIIENEYEVEVQAEFVRIECWKNLGYIYFNYSNPENVSIYFDVWSDDIDEYFISDITIEKLTESYIKGLLWIIELKNCRIDVLEKFHKERLL